MTPEEIAKRDQTLATLKPEIDSFVFTRLAGEVPLWEANRISEKIFDLIAETWQRRAEVDVLGPASAIEVKDYAGGVGGYGDDAPARLRSFGSGRYA